jgi:hypothetical protein
LEDDITYLESEIKKIKMNNFEDTKFNDLTEEQKKYLYQIPFFDELTEFINFPDGCITKNDDSVKIKISEEYRKKICEKIYQIFGLEYIEPFYSDEIKKLYSQIRSDNYSKHKINIKIKSIGLMNFLNRFFEIGFINNIMNPCKSYWRLSYDATLEDYLKKLDEF